MLRAIIFDMDGTICDSFPLMIRSLRESIEPIVGHPVSDEDFMEALGPNENGIITNMLGDRYEKAAKRYDTLYEMYLPEMCPSPFHGIGEIFEYLKQKNVKTALVTGKNKTSCDITLRQFGMENAFDAVEYGSPVGSRKKEAIGIVLDKFGICPKEALYLGDAPSDTVFSHELGLQAAAALWAPSTNVEETLAAGPDLVCRTPADFLRFLKETLG